MKILALDTATEACSVALGIGDRTLERYVELDRGHAEQILPMIDAVLSEAGLALSQLDALAFGRGPGGFTGVRLAASVAQGLAFGADLGVVPVSDLAAVAQRATQLEPHARHVLVVNDARMREVYWAAYEVQPELQQVGEERVDAPADVGVPAPGAPWVAAGRGLVAWPDLAERCRAAAPRCSRTCCLAPPKSSRSPGRAWRGANRSIPPTPCRFMSATGLPSRNPSHQTAIDCPCNAHATKTSPVMPCQQTCQRNRFWSSRTSAPSAR
jgi:tRNA threonylcarbamoyladenosine biosynthesis protein TsaB